MESENTAESNLWSHHQQVNCTSDDQNTQFYQSHYQPMVHHGFDLQQEIKLQQQQAHLIAAGDGLINHQQQQQPLPSTPDNVHFLRDNNGPFIKIYYDQRENPVFMNSADVFNNYLPNTQIHNSPSSVAPSAPLSMPFQQSPMMTMPSQAPPPQQQQQKTSSNSVIHHLVTSNLGPGKFGTFGGNNNNYYDNTTNANTSSSPLNISIPSLLEHVKASSSSSAASFIEEEKQQQHRQLSSSTNIINLSPNKFPSSSNIHSQSSSIDLNGSAGSNSENITPNVQVSSNNHNKKHRIVAEVKPMRMSYSDVVSKNASEGGNSSFTHSTNSSSSSPNTTMPINNNNNNNSNSSGGNKSGIKNEKNKFGGFGSCSSDKNRKSPTTVGNLSAENVLKRTTQPINNNLKPSTPPLTQKQVHPPINNPAKKKKLQGLNVSNAKSTSIRNQDGSTKSDNQRNHKYITDSERSSTIGSDEDNDDDDEGEDDGCEEEEYDDNYYNIRKNVYQGEHHKVEKIKSTSYKKSKLSTSISGTAAASSTAQSQKKSERTQKRVKVSNRKQKHEFLQKLIASCLEYVLIFAKWLWMLIYDVSYLSFGIIWDRLDWYYQCLLQGVAYMRRELDGNPGKVFILWLQSVWKKFDARFDKKSRWAFWRWMMFKKQMGNENLKDNFKDGRLPKTAEEAMKSLLNCKEKDAYSILGVSPDCPQEQIKKHYKKIAVLVHPDKNKQPGAEEAFKILQRSFELIGETESRKQYDENLAKALHTEKAFNELNDLLIQLQTKISEAANTIRCSACCFRHPRKPTGRKAFAARECKTCKIRHAGREGDIWAETTFFGLRWKYLALMEGNVYDITEWALCQRGALSHLTPNSCVVQYKIVLGGNQQQQPQNQGASGGDRFAKKEPQVKENMDDFFLNNIYAGQGPQQHQNARRRYKKN